MKNSFFVLLLSVILVSGCAVQDRPNQTIGTLLGGAGGAVAGAQFGSGKGQLAATAIGALLGAYVGSEIGASMDEVDRMKMGQAATKAFESAPTNSTTTWRNPDTGNTGTFTPTRTYEVTEGRYCREFTQTVVIDGKKQSAYGTACRQPDGSWEIER